ncbi:MAG: RNA-binding protein [Methylococcales bacterium]|jgi:RNA recognition motif-containing protein|nr:RNA-binding protein [Methylococcales bacterium]MBT6753265.1 RNA-binding protein [Candidatus Thioglobus sp.]MDG2364236.1 RNA-binding protein [Methylococcaceae bacterium]MBT3507000.1 RNA-binding protein [Methylococcales bacterium]MBT3698916.1 RNA-binding protein [Methylococcales bacterium]
MKKLFVGSLPHDATEESVKTLFAEFGTVRSIEIASDIFSGRSKGFGFIEMEGHEARAAIAGLNGRSVGDKLLVVKFEDPRKQGRGGRRR